MAKWIEYDSKGFTRDELFAIHESTRNQRNEHRHSIYTQLNFYFTIVSALLVTEITLCIFAIPFIYSDISNIYIQLVVLLLLLILPIISIVILINSMNNLKKEYAKLMQYLTVEQKIEAALGLMCPIQVSIKYPEKLPYAKETSILFPDWIKGSYENDSTKSFVDTTLENNNVLYAHLKKSLIALQILNTLVIVVIIFIGIILCINSANSIDTNQYFVTVCAESLINM